MAEGAPRFTWIPFYEELADKLLEYRDKREELVDIMYSLPPEYVDYLKYNKDQKLTDIDPFSIYGIFNRVIPTRTMKESWNKRFEICKIIKEKFNLKSDLPRDFYGIPVAMAFGANFSYQKNEEEIDVLWNLFLAAINFKDIEPYFDSARKQKGKKWNLTMVLYWIRPKLFMPLDTPSQIYLKNAGIKVFSKKNLNAENYLNLMEEIKKSKHPKIKEKDFPTISFEAWTEKKNPSGNEQNDMPKPNKTQIDLAIKLLKLNKNIILQGAPGTGKTYSTAEIALGVIGENLQNHDQVMERYEALQKEGQIFFTTFHQSMDYEDFIEGLKPEVVDGGKWVEYKVTDGIFKMACKKALVSRIKENSVLKKISSEAKVWKVSLAGTGENPIRSDCLKNGYIRIGWASYGNVPDFNEFEDFKDGGRTILRAFQSEMQEGDLVFSCFSNREIDAIGVVTGDYEFHENVSEYPRFRKVEWIVKNIHEDIYQLNRNVVMTLSTVYKLKISLEDALNLIRKCSKEEITSSDEEKPVVLIIDEINRGNVSKIFGELITLLEKDKRVGDDHPIRVTLPYSGEDFGVPSNVYIIGTMNTTDRSTGTLDYALRRRFSFVTLKADKQFILNPKGRELFEDVERFVEKFQTGEIELDDLMIGHSYFMAENDEELKLKIEYEVIPLLKEYVKDGLLNYREKEMKEYFEAWRNLQTKPAQKDEDGTNP
ncbi:MAG: AAA family ATPase [Thermoguttaceae bacterium]|nr:AAA family ATPase [Thermoguttaceae bacterium]